MPKKNKNKLKAKKKRKANQRLDFGPEELDQHHTLPKVYDPDPDRPGHLVLHRRNKTQTILDRYHHKGFITERQWRAGDRLRMRLRTAGLDAFVTVDLLKIGGQSASFMIPTSEAMAVARQDVRRTFAAVGSMMTKVLMAIIHDNIDVLQDYLPCNNNPAQLRASQQATVKLTLESLADHYGEPHYGRERRNP